MEFTWLESFKYRPRGIFSSGSEEPSALVQLEEKILQNQILEPRQ